jgi:hypothetical protein
LGTGAVFIGCLGLLIIKQKRTKQEEEPE